MFEQINEPIETIVEFRGSQVIPLKFVWHGREIIIKKLNLAYSNRDGRGKFYYFAVTDGTNYFKLQLNCENLVWTLLETYAD